MKFRTGETVRVINRACKYFDQVATVQEVVAGQQLPFGLSGLEVVPVWFGPHELILAEPDPSMHFMRGPIANVLPGIIEAVPSVADVTVTETRDANGRKALTITATWNEDQ